MNAFLQHFKFKFKAGIRNKTLLMLNYLFPIVFYLMMGLIMAEINPEFRDVLIPSMTTFAVLAVTLLGIPDPLVNARESGIFRSYKINGVPKASILAISMLTTMVHLIIIAVIISVSAPVFFDAPTPTNWLNFGLTFLVLSFASAGMSTLIGVISSNTRITVLWSQVFFLPSMLIGGLMFPHKILPDSVKNISLALPATHGMNAFNQLAMGGVGNNNPWLSMLILGTIGVLSILLASNLFKWDSANTIGGK